jgi:hypothetical protein
MFFSLSVQGAQSSSQQEFLCDTQNKQNLCLISGNEIVHILISHGTKFSYADNMQNETACMLRIHGIPQKLEYLGESEVKIENTSGG